MKPVLITGFDSYGGQTVNPSAKLARELDGQTIAGVQVVARTLPVSFESMPAKLRAHIDDVEPCAVISIGVWPGEPLIRLERLAINFAEFGIPDNDGALLQGSVSKAGAIALEATWPVRAIHYRLLEAGIPARISEHAGTYLCNAAFYTALGHVNGRADAPTVGFIHVPYLPEQVSEIILATRAEQRLELYQRQDIASMGFETQLAGVRLALSMTLEPAKAH